MGELKAYQQYKDSGVSWIGQIPAHWELKKLRNILYPVSERNRPDLPLLSVVREKGVIKRDPLNDNDNHNYIPDDLSNYKVVHNGQFAMNKMKAWQGSYGISNFDGIVSPAYFVFNLTGIEQDFFHKAIRSKAYVPFFTQASDGIRVGQWDLNQTRMKEIPFWIPPQIEQLKIARFLDWKTSQINKFIKAKKRQIELLKELKQVIINDAVTGKIDVRTGKPYPKYKDSGVEWLGMVPEEWEIKRIRNCIKDFQSGLWGEEPNESDVAIWCIRVADFNMKSLSINIHKKTFRKITTKDLILKGLRRGDILIEKSGGGDNQPVGRAVLFDFPDQAICSNFISRLRVNDEVVKSDYLLIVLFILQATRRNLPSIKQTTGIQNLDESHYYTNMMVLPNLKDQIEIINYINKQSRRIDNIIEKYENEISLIHEYKYRLIADSVTGKVDVREVKVPDIEFENEDIEIIESGENADVIEESVDEDV